MYHRDGGEYRLCAYCVQICNPFKFVQITSVAHQYLLVPESGSHATRFAIYAKERAFAKMRSRREEDGKSRWRKGEREKRREKKRRRVARRARYNDRFVKIIKQPSLSPPRAAVCSCFHPVSALALAQVPAGNYKVTGIDGAHNRNRGVLYGLDHLSTTGIIIAVRARITCRRIRRFSVKASTGEPVGRGAGVSVERTKWEKKAECARYREG